MSRRKRQKTDTLAGAILSCAQVWDLDPDTALDHLPLERAGFDDAFLAALPEIAGFLDTGVRDFIGEVYDEAATILAEHGDTVTETSLAFVQIYGPVDDVERLASDPAQAQALTISLKSHGRVAQADYLAVPPGVLDAQVLNDLMPGQLRGAARAAAQALERSPSEPDRLRGVLTALGGDTVRQPPPGPADAVTLITRCLVLVRQRTGTPEDLRADLLLAPETEAEAEALEDWVDVAEGIWPGLCFSGPGSVVDARTEMALSAIRFGLILDSHMQRQTATPTAAELHLHNAGDVVRVAARYGTFVAGPVEAPTSLCLANPELFFAALTALADTIVDHDASASFDALFADRTRQ